MDKEDSTKLNTRKVQGRSIDHDNSRSGTLSRHARRVFQDYLLVWLDKNFDESKEYYKQSIEQLRHILTSVIAFTDIKECKDFFNSIENEKVFMILSSSLTSDYTTEIHLLPHLDSIYVLCDNQTIHQQCSKTLTDVKDLHTQIGSICEALQTVCKRVDQESIPVSFQRIDAQFMYTQLLKEALLEISDDDEKAINEFIDYCHTHDIGSKTIIDKIQQEYFLHSPVWWYTGPYFINSVLNRGLRLLDTDVIVKMGFFIRHLHYHIQKLYLEQQLENKMKAPFRVFRGQGLRKETFEKMEKTKGGLMSFNSFLSTSYNRQVAVVFALSSGSSQDTVGIHFIMTIDPIECERSSIPFVTVKEEGHFQKEAEILFSTQYISY